MASENSRLGWAMNDSRIDSDPSAGATNRRPKAKAPSPWSVRGVSREARAKAAKAASRRRETLGEWVTNALTQIANEELGTGPRREGSQYATPGLPVSPADDETPLGKAMLALAERFERSEKRNDAISALAQRVDIAESSGRDVSIMAEKIGIMEHRSRALTLLVDRLETADRREKTLLTLMHTVAERAERGEERIAAVTRGLADMASQLESALNRNSIRTAQDINQSIMPLETAVNALGSRLAAQPAAPQPAAASAAAPSAATQFYGTPAENAADPVQTEQEAPEIAEFQDEAPHGESNAKRLKFDFDALNKRAIKNSQRLAQEPEAAAADEKDAGGGWFGKGRTAQEPDLEAGKATASDDWAAEALADEAPESGPSRHPHEPQLAEEIPAKEPEPAVSEEDEMLMAIKTGDQAGQP